MVRLKPPEPPPIPYIKAFQFLNGSIKAPVWFPLPAKVPKFQFLNGSIKAFTG